MPASTRPRPGGKVGSGIRRRPAARQGLPLQRYLTGSGELRIGPVAALPQVLSDLGVAPRRVFARAGVKLAAFRDPESRISLEALGRLFEMAVELANCPDIGLLVGTRFTLKNLGAVGDLMSNSRTVGDALGVLLRYQHLHNRGAVPILIPFEAASVLLCYSIYQLETPGTRQIYDTAIAIGFRILREFCGARWEPLIVQFAHRRPEDLGLYRQLFGHNLRFDADISGIAFASAWLDHCLVSADPALHDRMQLSLIQAMADAPLSFSDQVQRALHQMVLSGTAAAGNVARLFGIHERTLRKRLSSEGTTLRRLVDATRFQIAEQLLRNTRLPASEIATTLHYADLSTFSRAFKTWAKISPQRYREAR